MLNLNNIFHPYRFLYMAFKSNSVAPANIWIFLCIRMQVMNLEIVSQLGRSNLWSMRQHV